MPLESLGGEDIGKSKHPQRSDKFWRTIQELVSYSTRRDMTSSESSGHQNHQNLQMRGAHLQSSCSCHSPAGPARSLIDEVPRP